MKEIFITTFSWDLSSLWLAATNQGLARVEFERARDWQQFRNSLTGFRILEKENAILEQARDQFRSYFNGNNISFTIRLDVLGGTPFQQMVWKEVKGIPYGFTATYKQIARRIGKAKAVRAVGAANGANPLPIVIPCHRVVSSNGKLGGYGGGLEIKDALLRLEGVVL